MKENKRSLQKTIMALGIAVSLPVWCQAQGPSGQFIAGGSGPANAVWDFSALPELGGEFEYEIEDDGETELRIHYPISLQLNGAGKLTGGGPTFIGLDTYDEDYNEWEFYNFEGTYKATGTVTGSGGVARLKVSVAASGMTFLEGAQRRITVAHSASVAADNHGRASKGINKSKASASGLGSISGSEAWGPEPFPAGLGNGEWTLVMNLAMQGTKVVGTQDAVVTLHSGREFRYLVKGVYNAKTQHSMIVLSGKDNAKGSSLKIVINPFNQVRSVQGKIAGQFVNLSQ